MYAAWYPSIFPRSMCFVVVIPNIFSLEITDDKEGSISPVIIIIIFIEDINFTGR